MAKRKAAELRVIDAEPIGEDAAARLEEALEQVRNGAVSSVGLALVYRDGSTGTCWSEAPSIGTLIGAVARLQHRLLKIGDE